MNYYYNPVRTICGNLACEKTEAIVNEICPAGGNVLLLVWNESVLRQNAFMSIMDSTLHTVKPVCFNASNPTVEQLYTMYKDTRNFEPDVVIAVGGGSVMDVGKSLCCLYGKQIDSADALRELIKSGEYGEPAAKWIGVPTTAGTGSEVTCWATIWDPAKNAKRSVESHKNYAYAAVVDDAMIKGMPVSLAVSSALDAMAHAVEAYWANGSNVVSKALSIGAIKTIMQHIDTLLEGDESAGAYMSQGSMMAGLAFSNTKTTAGHSVSYPLTMHYGIPHGVAVSMVLPEIFKININSIEDSDELFYALGIENCEAFVQRIRSILQRAQIPATLQAWKVDYDKIPELASQGITKGRADNNPVSVTNKMIEEILYSIYS